MKRDDLYDLVAFAVVAEQRSFTRAAAELGMSQSALSHAMKALEERLGVRLLSRTTRSVATTSAGETLLRSLRPALEEIASGVDTVGALRGKPSLVFNNTDLIREAALSGHGLAYCYQDEVAADIEAGRLTRILEKWCPTFPGYHLYHPSRRQTPPALAALIGALRYRP